MAFCSAPLHKKRAVRGCGVFRASGALHTLRVHSHPCHKTKKREENFHFFFSFFTWKAGYSARLLFLQGVWMFEKPKKVFHVLLFQPKTFKLSFLYKSDFSVFWKKIIFLQKLLILAHGFHQFFVYNLWTRKNCGKFVCW